MTTPKDDRKRLHLLMAALADSVADASDDEILDDARSASADLAAVAARVQGVLGDAVLKTKKVRLQKAREGHAAAVAAYRARSTTLPEDPSARRALLGAVIARQPEMRQAVMTLQHRDFGAFTDDDVESALRQLDALGLLTDGEPDAT